jgi:hypothetical protein
MRGVPSTLTVNIRHQDLGDLLGMELCKQTNAPVIRRSRRGYVLGCCWTPDGMEGRALIQSGCRGYAFGCSPGAEQRTACEKERMQSGCRGYVIRTLFCMQIQRVCLQLLLKTIFSSSTSSLYINFWS